MKPVISFVICSWQAPASVETTLDSIAGQPEQGCSETILVNNGFSSERAAELRQKYQKVHLQIVDEPRPGLGFARLAGFAAARGDAIVMLDDDNALRGEFIPRLLEICRDNANWGGICSAVIPVWQVVPPAWLENFGKTCLSYNTLPKEITPPEFHTWKFPEIQDAPRPPGGGMIVHRSVFENYIATATDSKRIGIERMRHSLEGCQDADIYDRISAVGRDALKSNQLQIEHHIPASRLEMRYLARLNYQMTVSNMRLMRYWRTQRGYSSLVSPWYQRWWRLLLIGQSAARGKTPAKLFALLLCRELGILSGHLVAAGK